jgi:hypothetical protein
MKSTQPDQDSCDARNRPCLCEVSVDCRETRLAHFDGFARVFPPGGGRSGHNYQILREDHEHHHHHHQCKLSLVEVVVSVLPLLFQQHPFLLRLQSILVAVFAGALACSSFIISCSTFGVSGFTVATEAASTAAFLARASAQLS